METQNDLSIFRIKAEAIVQKYSAELEVLTSERGSRPSFDELMGLLKNLEKELTGAGVQYAEEHKAPLGALDNALTDGLKAIIRDTIEHFIKTL